MSGPCACGDNYGLTGTGYTPVDTILEDGPLILSKFDTRRVDLSCLSRLSRLS